MFDLLVKVSNAPITRFSYLHVSHTLYLGTRGEACPPQPLQQTPYLLSDRFRSPLVGRSGQSVFGP